MATKDTEMRIFVGDDFFERLTRIKEYYGVKTNAEMIRVLVSEKYHEISEKPTKK